MLRFGAENSIIKGETLYFLQNYLLHWMHKERRVCMDKLTKKGLDGTQLKTIALVLIAKIFGKHTVCTVHGLNWKVDK